MIVLDRYASRARIYWRFLVHREMAEEPRWSQAWLDRMVSTYGRWFWHYI